jgi:hypothetical protein
MQKIIKTIAVLLIMAGTVSCDNNEEDFSSPDPDPVKAIVGKWELLTLQQPDGSYKKSYKPTGYVEYLPDSTMAWYDYATKKYEILRGKYWLDSNPYSERENDWMLHYTRIMIDDLSMYEYYPDKPPGNNFECYFISANKMSLYCIDILSYVRLPDYIYKRKK